VTAELADLLAEVEAGPAGPEVGAFFDLDGTLIAGYSARVFYGEFLRSMQMSPVAIGRSLVAALDMALRGGEVTPLVEIAAREWEGRSEDELDELGERLFVQKIAGMVYPHAREIVRVHRRMGHTVALASSATHYQVAPLAADLEVGEILCTRLQVDNGVLTGALAGPVLWGEEKARAVREFAGKRGVDLTRSYAYGNGSEDVPFMEAVGRPRPVNPESELAKAAERHGWPIHRLSGRGRPGLRDLVRTGAAIAGLGSAAALGGAIALLNRDRRLGANFAIAVGSEAALALAGVRLRVIGEERLWTHRPAVFIFNHQSGIDVPVIGRLLERDFTGVAKKEAARDPRFAPIGSLVDVAYVERGNTAQAKDALAPVVERIREGISFGIAPEGTRTPTPRPGRFKKGAFHIAMQAGVPIVPIVIRNAGDVMWRRSMLIRPGTIDVAVLEPISVEGWKVEDLDERVAEVRQLFVDTLENWPDGARGGRSAARARRAGRSAGRATASTRAG
jgi:putative phosphoserine phosphatase/1-acylglycerol-3-phosphate O-acyltransferase